MDANKLIARSFDGVKFGYPDFFVENTANLDLQKHDYAAVKLRGNCLSTRPEPVKDGDTIFVRELQNWSDFASSDPLHGYKGKLIGLAVGNSVMCKELVFVDYAQKVVTVKMFNPLQILHFRFGQILKAFVIDAIVSHPITQSI